MALIAWYWLGITIFGIAISIGDIGKPREPLKASTVMWAFLSTAPVWYFIVTYLESSH